MLVWFFLLTVVFEVLLAEECLPLGKGFTTTFLSLDKSNSLVAFRMLKSNTTEVEAMSNKISHQLTKHQD